MADSEVMAAQEGMESMAAQAPMVDQAVMEAKEDPPKEAHSL